MGEEEGSVTAGPGSVRSRLLGLSRPQQADAGLAHALAPLSYSPRTTAGRKSCRGPFCYPRTMPATTTSASSATARTPMSEGVVVAVLALLLGLQPVTTDLYLPALPAMTQGFGASMGQAQLTLTSLLLAFGLSQLVWGPLSDRFGRKPILLAGVTAFVAASLGCALATSMPALILWRALQGAAMGAGVMAARALVRDLYEPEAGARAMSRGLTGLGFIACASAPLGAFLSEASGWRFALGAILVFGVATLAMVVLRFEETLARPNPRALQPATVLATWKRILRNPTFWAYSCLASFTFAGLFTFLASSSFIFMDLLGVSRTHYGLLMFSMSAAYIAGTFLCRRLLVRYGLRRTVAIGGALSLAGGTGMGLLALAGLHSTWSILLPYYLFMLGHGIHQPCGQSGAVAPFPDAAGAASALNGFLMMVLAFGIGEWLGTRMDQTVYPLTNGVWLWGVGLAVVAWTLVQRHGEPRRG